MIGGLDSHDDINKATKSPEKTKTPTVLDLNKPIDMVMIDEPAKKLELS